MKTFQKISKTVFRHRKFIIFILFLIVWAIALSKINIHMLALKLSDSSAYLVAFLAALLGGVSVFTSSSYLATLVILSSGSANPALIALAAGTALTLGDILFYFFGRQGRKALPPRFKEVFERAAKVLRKRPAWQFYIFTYLYTGLTPLPTDVLMLLTSFLEYPFRRVIVPLFFGNVTLVLVIYGLVRLGLDFAGA